MSVIQDPIVTGIVGNPLHLTELSGNPATRADTGFVYTKEVATVTELFYKDSAGNVIQITSGGMVGSGSATAQFLTLAATADLTSERVFTPGTGITGTDAGAGSTYTVAVNQGFAPTWTGVHTFTEATSPIVTAKLGPVAGQQHALPAVASDTIALLAATQTLTNKTLTDPIIATVIGGTGSGDDITLRATSHATDGDIIFQTDSTNEVARFTASEIKINDAGANQDFRLETVGNTHTVFIDASANAIGFFTSTPTAMVHLKLDQNAPTYMVIENQTDGTDAAASLVLIGDAGCVLGVQNFSDSYSAVPALAGAACLITSASPAPTNGMIIGNRGAKIVKFITNDVERMRIETGGEVVVNNTAASTVDFKVVGASDANTFYVDVSADTVQVGASTTADSAKFYVSGKVSTSGELEVNGAFNHDGSTFGALGATPAAQASAYTQTYSTVDRTHANFTSADIGAFTGGSVGFLDAAERDNIRTQFNALRADVADLKQLVNAVIDDIQSFGFAG